MIFAFVLVFVIYIAIVSRFTYERRGARNGTDGDGGGDDDGDDNDDDDDQSKIYVRKQRRGWRRQDKFTRAKAVKNIAVKVK